MRRIFSFLLAVAILPASAAAQKIHVTNPAAGASWSAGTSQEITWTRTGTMDANVRIVLLRSSGSSVGRIEENTPNDGSYTWAIPADTEPGTYKIRVVTVDGAVRDTSGNFTIIFTINPAILRRGIVVSPPCDFGIESVTFADGNALNRGISYPSRGNLSGVFQVIALWNGNPPPASDCSYSIEVWNTMTNGVCGRSTSPRNFNTSNADGSRRIRVSVPFTVLAENIYRSIRNRVIPLEFRLVPSGNDCDADDHNNRRSEDMHILNIPTETNFVVEIVPGSCSATTTYSTMPDWDNLQFRIRFRVKNLSRMDSGAPVSAVHNVKYKYNIEYINQGKKYYVFGAPEGIIPVVSATDWTEISINRDSYMLSNWWAPLEFFVVIDPDQEFFDPNRLNNTRRFEFRLSHQ